MQPVNRARREIPRRGGQQRDGLEQRDGGHRHHHIQLEEAAGLTEGDGGVVADDARHDHRQALDDHRIHLARHDRGPRLRLRQGELADTRPWPHSHQPDIGGDLPERQRDRSQAAVSGNHRVQGALGVEVIFSLPDFESCRLREPTRRALRELGMCIDPRSHCRPTKRDHEQLRLGGLRPTDRLLELACITPEFLAKSDRRCVLEVRAPRLDDRPELVGLGFDSSTQSLEGRQQLLLDRHRGRQLHRRRHDIVGALTAIDVVIGMDRRASVQPLRGEVGDHLVEVRIRGRAGSGLIHVDGELIVVAPLGDLGRRRSDGVRLRLVEQSQVCVRLGRGSLDQRHRAQEAPRKGLARDREVEHRALRRSAVKRVSRHLDLAHRVALHACLRAGRTGCI